MRNQIDESEARRLDIHLIDTTSLAYSAMTPLQMFGANQAQETVYAAARDRRLAPLHYKGKVLDFGCGVGGSSYFLHQNGADIIAVDLSDSSIQELKNLQAIPLEKIVEGDGFKLMGDTPNNTFDMVTCFMLGPDSDGEFIDRFYQGANRIIKENGRILITSDGATFNLLVQKYRGNYGNNLHERNVFVGRKNPELL